MVYGWSPRKRITEGCNIKTDASQDDLEQRRLRVKKKEEEKSVKCSDFRSEFTKYSCSPINYYSIYIYIYEIL